MIAGVLALAGIYIIFRSHAAINNADFNNDGIVNITDLSILASHWNQTGLTQAQGDANGDGAVNITDLSILATQWGTNPGGGGGTAGCTTTNNGIAGFPCATQQGGAAGVPTGTNLRVLTSCTGGGGSCSLDQNGQATGLPSGMSWSASQGFYLGGNCTTPIVLSGWEFIGLHGLSVAVGNGTLVNGTAPPATPCVTIKNSLFKGDAGVGIYQDTSHCNGFSLCGPVVLQNDEFTTKWDGPFNTTPGVEKACGGSILSTDCFVMASGKNLYLANDYFHELLGWATPPSGNDAIVNTVMRDEDCGNMCPYPLCDQAHPTDPYGRSLEPNCNNGLWANGADHFHAAMWEINQFNNLANFWFKDNVFSCNWIPPSSGVGCSADVTVYPNSKAVDNILFDHNLFTSFDSGPPGSQSTQVTNCTEIGVSGGAGIGDVPPGITNVIMKNNVWDANNGGNCGVQGVAQDFRGWDARNPPIDTSGTPSTNSDYGLGTGPWGTSSYTATHNDYWCNNLFSNGTRVMVNGIDPNPIVNGAETYTCP